MKKSLLCLATVALLALASCSDQNHCYEFTTTVGPLTTTTYLYCTKTEAEAHKSNLTTSASTCTFKKVSKSEADCKNF